jgi:hypothetical protein
MLAVSTTIQKKQTFPFQSGQIWQMKDSRVQIGVVGKTLVHYKHFKGQAKRSPNSLSGKQTLERFLKIRKAVLMPAQSVSKPARGLRP